jgi:hypothetical protein
MSLDEVTLLLRTGDTSLVEDDLVDLLVTGEQEWLKGDRDLMMALAPHANVASTRALLRLTSSRKSSDLVANSRKRYACVIPAARAMSSVGVPYTPRAAKPLSAASRTDSRRPSLLHANLGGESRHSLRELCRHERTPDLDERLEAAYNQRHRGFEIAFAGDGVRLPNSAPDDHVTSSVGVGGDEGSLPASLRHKSVSARSP